MPFDPFDLPASLAAKTAPDLIDTDRAHLRMIAAALQSQRDDAARRLAAARMRRADNGGAAVERDLEIRRLSSRLHGRARDPRVIRPRVARPSARAGRR